MDCSPLLCERGNSARHLKRQLGRNCEPKLAVRQWVSMATPADFRGESLPRSDSKVSDLYSICVYIYGQQQTGPAMLSFDQLSQHDLKSCILVL